MNQNILHEHAAEIGREIRAHRYEETPHGILLSRPRLHIGGAIKGRVAAPGEPFGAPQLMPNLVPLQGRHHILNLAMPPTAGYAPITLWFLAPFKGDYTPDDNLTAANFAAGAQEFIDYTSPTRPQLTVPSAASGSAIAANEVVLTITGAGASNIYGAALISASAKSAVTGLLLAGVRLDFPFLNLIAGYRAGFEYVLAAQDAG